MEAFLKRGATYLVQKWGWAFWSKQKGTFGVSLPESQLIEHVEYLVDNIFIWVSDKVYKQVVGIPMGTDCAPLLAIFFFFVMNSSLWNN